ncbi:hypothetical protein BGZ47_009684 [Haplosporangium gracile]|nr:hypothetical protein BGZ47_009684 [Haplosporangium gracile]
MLRSITPAQQQQQHPLYPLQGGHGQGGDHHQQLYPPSIPVFVKNAGVAGMGADYGSQALMRLPPAHRNPNSRAKWSPVMHTIAEVEEFFSGTVIPAKLYSNDTNKSYNNSLNPYDKNTDNGHEAKTETSPTSASNDNEEVEEAKTMDILLGEIQHLVAHDFSGPNKSAPYPTVFKPLYQRLQDCHIILKKARRKLNQPQQHQHQHQQRGATVSSMVEGLSAGSEASSNKLNLAAIATTASATAAAASPVSTPAAARLQMKHVTNNNNNFLEVSTTIAASSSTCSSRAMMIGQDTGDHILSLKKTSSHFLVGPTSNGTGGATAKLPVSDACAIHGILASVNSESSSTLPLFSSSTSGGGINKSKKKKMDFLSSPSLKKENDSVGSGSSVETPNDIFQKTLRTAIELHSHHIRQLKGISVSTSANASPSPPPATFNESTTNPSTNALLSFDSEPCLFAVGGHQLISEATIRLLHAETELDLLKLVMAQNQCEISGLEEDVFRAQR